ncbi:hypothetical protein [Nocardia sp. NPDC046763]|uniref:hypothetical protein n=1 Tax=Nocardia sp. NPDC046763 TaxID=3155256 RepID=UPI0033EAED38
MRNATAVGCGMNPDRYQRWSLRDSTDGFLIVGGLVVAAGSAVLLRRTTRP